MAGNKGLSRRRQRKGKAGKDEKKVHFPIAWSGGFEEAQVICYLWEIVKFIEAERTDRTRAPGEELVAQKTDEQKTLERLENQIRSRVRVEIRRYFLRQKRRTVKLIAGTASVAASLILLFQCVLGVDRVSGNSMYPYLNHGDWIVYTRIKAPVKRNDVVIFEKQGENLVKRVAGLPGDTVAISSEGDRVVINGQLLQETYVTLTGQERGNVGIDGNAPIEDRHGLTVLDGQYMVLGDNRSVSIDSRDSRIGTVSEEDILGRVLLVLRIHERNV